MINGNIQMKSSDDQKCWVEIWNDLFYFKKWVSILVFYSSEQNKEGTPNSSLKISYILWKRLCRFFFRDV